MKKLSVFLLSSNPGWKGQENGNEQLEMCTHTGARGTCSASSLDCEPVEPTRGCTMTLNYRHLLLVAALFMISLAVMTTVQGYFDHSPIIVIFQFLASALLLYWAFA